MSDEKDARLKYYAYGVYDVKVNGASEVKEGKNAGRTMISGTFRVMGGDGKDHVKLFAAFDGEKMNPASKILELLPAIAEARAACAPAAKAARESLCSVVARGVRNPSAATEPELWLTGSFRNKSDIGKDGVRESRIEFVVSSVDTKDERAAFREARQAAAPARSKECDWAEVGL